VKVRNEFEFHSLKDYNEWLKSNPPLTLNKEVVKSYGEMRIANFLFASGIKYNYEESYFIDTRDQEYGQYHPDFYLPEYDIYIEYFGINRDNKVPSYFVGKGEKTANEVYIESMKWKRELHRDNNTTLIECYGYENMEGILTTCLKEKLLAKSVILNPLSSKEMLSALTKDNENVLNGLVDLFGTIINLIKSNDYSLDYVKELSNTSKDRNINNTILYLINPIYMAYNRYLFQNNLIDFNDMINKARKYVDNHQYNHSYKYVIVDEYQDISKARYNLLKSMRVKKDFELFCVGDDWQSIYRFTGSDIDYIVNFAKHWGPTQISRIETTYRFNQSLINISSSFVMENPLQIKKTLKSKLESDFFALAEVSGYNENIAVTNLTKRLDDLPTNSTVFFLGRYNYDIKILDHNKDFNYYYDNASKIVRVVYAKKRNLKISYLTAHTSKGLQADYVFILNNKNSRMGFPSKVADSSLVELLLEGKDMYPFSEERRLFYVALTRAKKKTYLLTQNGRESIFVEELKKVYETELKNEFFTCPLCGGRLLKRNGKYGVFWGCSNYSSTGCKYVRSLKG